MESALNARRGQSSQRTIYGNHSGAASDKILLIERFLDIADHLDRWRYGVHLSLRR